MVEADKPNEASMTVEDDMLMAPQAELTMLGNQVSPTSLYFRSPLDYENGAAFAIRNKQVMTLSVENVWTPLGACQFYHSRLVPISGLNTCLVVGGSVDIEGTRPTDKVYAFSKDVIEEKKPMSISRSKVGLCATEVRSEQSAFFNKTYVFAFGGHNGKSAVKTVQQFNVKANVWRSLADLNVARACASGAILGDYLYVFGGSELEMTIERFNLKASMTKVIEKFDILEVKLPVGSSEIGIIPLPSRNELMLIGGFGGQLNEKEHSLGQRLRFIANEDGTQGSADFIIEDLSQTQNEELTAKSEMKPDFFQASQMIVRNSERTLIFGAQFVHAFDGATFVGSETTHQ
jgi:hypothetical protein